MLRTHTCGQLRSSDVNTTPTLCGWVHRRRDHGGLIFIDLRDRYGLTQIVFDPEVNAEAHAQAEAVRPEWVLQVTGTVEPRKEGMNNANMATGDIEVFVTDITVLNQAKTPPFEIDKDEINVREDLRLEYRYLDLRRARLQKNIAMRAQMTQVIRKYFAEEGFLDIETPIMVKGTPEGSREYLVPSRLHHGSFYVLPQSPQQLKQLLMVGGIDKYFQIARCFRDEDLRGDRQPEFTQFEIEMSFVAQEDVIDVIERCFHVLTAECAPEKEWQKYLVDGKFRRLTWDEAMNTYGSDKPDLRFEMPIVDVTQDVAQSGFGVFKGAVDAGGVVKALRCEGGGELTRKEIDDLTELAKTHGAKGLAYIVYEADGSLKSPIVKFMNEKELAAIATKTGAKPGDVVFFGADEFITACEALGAVRNALGTRFELKNENDFAYCWVTDFPMFERKEDGTLQAAHHPFTRPHEAHMDTLESDPIGARAYAYDVVLNGVELGGGSIRIHEPELQQHMFDVLGLTKEETEMKFGHLIKAFSYGAPPHGGCAMGLDRVVMLFAGEPNIREVMAFPKNQSAQDLMLGSPAPMPEKELREQNIQVLPRASELA